MLNTAWSSSAPIVQGEWRQRPAHSALRSAALWRIRALQTSARRSRSIHVKEQRRQLCSATCPRPGSRVCCWRNCCPGEHLALRSHVSQVAELFWRAVHTCSVIL